MVPAIDRPAPALFFRGAVMEKEVQVTGNRDRRVEPSSYSEKALVDYYRFLIPEGCRILEIGCGRGDLIGNLRPSAGIGLDTRQEMIRRAGEKYPRVKFVCGGPESLPKIDALDYVIIRPEPDAAADLYSLLTAVTVIITPETRVVVHGRPSSRFRRELKDVLSRAGFRIIKEDMLLLRPRFIPVFPALAESCRAGISLITGSRLEYCALVRLNRPPDNVRGMTTSVVLTCRDEAGNIEPLVEGLPVMGSRTELIFVEGHSVDDTADRIRRMMRKFPEKNIKLYRQPGIGQGDAFRMGFDRAEGDFIIWFEADLTTPPGEAALVWEAYAAGRGEYINGTRFVHAMENKAMPFLNYIGNRFFGLAFTAITGQRFTDTLCGVKGISKKNYRKIAAQKGLDDMGDPFGDFELILGAARNGLEVAEVPVHYNRRRYGRPKSYGTTLAGFLRHAARLLRISGRAFMEFRLRRS